MHVHPDMPILEVVSDEPSNWPRGVLKNVEAESLRE
jgi:hypothetical protein